MGDVVQQHRDRPAADDQHQHDKAGDLGERNAEAGGERSVVDSAGSGAALRRERAGDRRQQNQHDDHQQILHHQPADDDVAAIGFDQVALLQAAHQHDRAGHRQRNAEHDAANP